MCLSVCVCVCVRVCACVRARMCVCVCDLDIFFKGIQFKKNYTSEMVRASAKYVPEQFVYFDIYHRMV